ncbi:DUF4271 domain-containing protein [Flavobacteriaceae bacterium]|nr:DUF4271 domain-containing protein [Flavobacteriaceae bacterium]
MIRDYILFDGFTIIILLNIIIVTIAKALNNSKFKQFIFIYLNNSFLKFNTNNNSFLSSFNSLLNINYLISLSVYISIIISYSSYGINNNFEISIFFKTLLIVIVFVYAKYLIELLVGWAFSISKFIVTFNFQKNNFNKLIGIIIILLNSLTIYSFPNSMTFIKMSIFFVISLYLIGLYKVIRLNDNLILSNMFYFILYLCTLEIVPILFFINELI